MTSYRGGNLRVSINKVVDIEENIWSPTFGIRGKIDVSLEFMVEQNGAVQTYHGPLEFKTGKSTRVQAHRTQTILYLLLMSDRYGILFG